MDKHDATTISDEEIVTWWASENKLEDCEMCKLKDFATVVRAVEAKLAALRAPLDAEELRAAPADAQAGVLQPLSHILGVQIPDIRAPKPRAMSDELFERATKLANSSWTAPGTSVRSLQEVLREVLAALLTPALADRDRLAADARRWRHIREKVLWVNDGPETKWVFWTPDAIQADTDIRAKLDSGIDAALKESASRAIQALKEGTE